MYIDQIRQMRKQKGMSQQKIAEALKITQQQYQQNESGRHEMPVRYFREICLILKADANKILELPHAPSKRGEEAT